MGPNAPGVLYSPSIIAQGSREEELRACCPLLGHGIWPSICSSQYENLNKGLSRGITPALFMAQQLVVTNFNCLAAITHNACNQKGYGPGHSCSSLEMLSPKTQGGFGNLDLSTVVLQFSEEGNQLVRWTGGCEHHFSNPWMGNAVCRIPWFLLRVELKGYGTVTFNWGYWKLNIVYLILQLNSEQL